MQDARNRKLELISQSVMANKKRAEKEGRLCITSNCSISVNLYRALLSPKKEADLLTRIWNEIDNQLHELPV